MRNSGGGVVLLLLLHLLVVALVSAKGSNLTSRWQTLSGKAPLVVARGGFSGLFADSSSAAYSSALLLSVPDVILWCDVQLTKDGAGICLPDLKLENSTLISSVFAANREKAYLVNGVPTKAYFSVDFTLRELSYVYLTQGVYSRTNKFDGQGYSILTVQNVAQDIKPPGLWLNIQHDVFFTQHNLSMRTFVLSVSRTVRITYISSPEVGFLRRIAARFNPRNTKLVFRFLGKDEIDPSTNKSYRSLLSNLTFIKTFASGILVPKAYIWPVDDTNYLQPHTSLVLDAHKQGLEVFASDFVNDVPLSFNYSYDPVSESLYFIDNGRFTVDGLLTDFPVTHSMARDCFAHLGRNATAQVEPLVISKYGASGDYTGSTDLAYTKAIDDGVDVLDCPVQLTKDGIPFCLSSINLMDSTNVIKTTFSNLQTTIPEISVSIGIFTFNLTWSQIQTLRPSIVSPYTKFQLFRNPGSKSDGNFLRLAEFLSLSKNARSLRGVLISIENAVYLAEKVGLSVTDAVVDALKTAGFDNLTSKKVMIQSPDSAVLKKFKDKYNYERVYEVGTDIGDVLNSAAKDIKSFATSVVVKKESVFTENNAFLVGQTDTVSKLKAFKLPVYVQTFSNEFVSQAWDFFSDATVEINSFFAGVNIDGVITGFPKTAARYKRNRCLGEKPPSYMTPVNPGDLIQLVTSEYLPPAEAPLPVLKESNVAEPILAPVAPKAPNSIPSAGPPEPEAPSPGNGQPKIASCSLLRYLSMLLASFLIGSM